MLALTSCEMFEFDNFDGPDAKVTGTFLDNGTPVQMETYGTVSSSWWGTTTTLAAGIMQVTETGWDAEAMQNWYVKYNGTYRNDRVFAGSYKLDFTKLNVYNQDDVTFTLKKGENTNVNFNVTPYCRILEPQITYDATAKQFKATFKVQLGDPTKANIVESVVLAANTNNFVGYYFNYCNQDQGARATNIAVDSTGTTETITLYLDANPAGVNVAEFQYHRPHYLRICALAGGVDNPNKLYNYSPVYVVDADDFSKITEYVWE